MANIPGFNLFSPYGTPIKYVGDSLYMESGILDMLNIARGNINTYKPAKIRFTSTVIALNNLYPNPSIKNKLKDKDESLAVGCTTKLARIDVRNEYDEILYTFDSSPPDFCYPETIRARKTLMLRIPPSVFTGKMRNYIQALYGSKRKDFTGSETIAGYKLSLDTGHTKVVIDENTGESNSVPILVELYPESPSLVGLYSLPNNKYALITIEGTNIIARLMLPITTISTVHAIHSNNSEISELYILANLRPSHIGVTIGTMLSGMDAYSPLAYGWHFNMDGNKAVCALHRGVNITGTTQTGEVKTRLGWSCLLSTITINLTLTNNILTGSAGTFNTPNTQFFPYAQIKIYTPNPFAQDVMNIAFTEFADTFINSSDVPLYAYYKDNDLKVVYGSSQAFTIIPAYSDPTWNTTDVGILFGISTVSERGFWGASMAKEGVVSHTGGYTSTGTSLSFEGIDYIGLDESLDSVSYSYASLGGTNANAGQNFYDFGPSSKIYSTHASKSSKVTRYALVIPYHDSQAVYINVLHRVQTINPSFSLNYLSNYIQFRDDNGPIKDMGSVWLSSPQTDPTDFMPLTENNKDFVPNQTGNLYYFNSKLIAPLHLATIDDPTYGYIITKLDAPPDVVDNPTFETIFESYTSVGGSIMQGIQRTWTYVDWPEDLIFYGVPVGYA
jgi:hypothetical protein